MNVFDFDKTIYKGDSTVDFYLFELKRNPSILLVAPKQVYGILGYFLKIHKKTKMKELFYSFLTKIPNIKTEVDEFWNEKEKDIYEWYLKKHKKDDVVISASPRFILQNICTRLDIKYLLCSEVDENTGKYTGLNCYGEEKVARFKETFNKLEIDEFYSDSLSDSPLADISKKAFIIKNGDIFNWPIKEK